MRQETEAPAVRQSEFLLCADFVEKVRATGGSLGVS
jgi:hypothetical protein